MICVGSLFATQAMAIDVANQADWNTAVAAVAAAGAGSTVSINVTGSFTLTSSLAQLQASNANVTVNVTGNSQTINGASAFQGIVVNGANAPTVNISSLALANTAAVGGVGGNGSNGFYSPTLSYGSGGGGGGGLGAGGGLLVGSGANVTIAAVTFTGNTATGGSGGNGGVAQNAAPDPVNGGNGGAGGTLNGGGAVGGGGAGGLGGNTGTQGTTGTAGVTLGAGGGGGGGSGTTNSTAYTPNNAGGGGNADGGAGQYGGDGVTNNQGSQGPGSDGGSGGNGGSAQGGAIYVATGGTLTILDSPISGAAVIAGGGGSGGVGQGPDSFNGNPGSAGSAQGAGVYLNGVTANIGVSGGTVTYANAIGGTGLSTGGINTAITKTGAGMLVLSAINTFTGNVNISAGTLAVAGTANLGNANNSVVISNGATLAATATATFGNQRAFSIAGSSTFDIAAGTTSTIQGVVSDGAAPGNLIKAGTGTLTLSGPNTYTGGTTFNSGILSISSDTNLGNASGGLTFDGGTLQKIGGVLSTARNVLLNSGGGTLDFQNLFTATGNLTGTGGLTVKDSLGGGGGTLSLSGNNTYFGATHILQGSISAGSDTALSPNSAYQLDGGTALSILGAHSPTVGSLAGSGLVRLYDPFTFQAGNLTTGFDNTSTTFSGIIDGLGSLTKTGSGTLALSGANTYTGGTMLSQGTIQVGVDSTFTNINDPSTQTSSALGVGKLRFDGGTLMAGFLADRRFGNAVEITANGGTVDDAGGLVRLFGSISDAASSHGGTLTLMNSGPHSVGEGILLGGVSTYSGATNIASGTILVESAAALSPNSAFRVNTGATLTLNSFSNTIASLADGIDGGGIVQNAAASGTATLSISGASRGTTSFSGVLRGGVGEGGAGPRLALIKDGGSTQILSGINTYTGATSVNGGTLSVNGSIASSSLTTVNAGGTLGGNGTVGNTLINGGTLSPGNSIGALTVAGNLVLTAASTYMVEVSPSASDFTHVTGTATLNGATVAAQFAPGSYVEKRYTILTADGGVSGAFSGPVNANLPTNFKTALAHDGNNAYLDLNLNFFRPTSLNVNQQNVATTLTNFFNSTGGIPLAFGALSPQGLTQVSGELATGTQQTTFDAMNLFMGVMTDPFMAGRGGDAGTTGGASPFAPNDEALGYAARGNGRDAAERNAYAAMARKVLPMAPTFEQRWNVWAAGYGGSQTTSGNSVVGSNTATSSLYGVAVGADYRVSLDTLVGFAMSGGATQFRTANGLGSGRSDLFQAGAFFRHNIGNAYLSGALAYGWQDVTTDRTVTAAGIERLRANFNTNAFSGRLEGGYRIATPLIGITPYAAGQFTTYDLPAYAEQSSAGSLFALNYAAKNVTSSRSELGLRTDKSFALNDAILTLRSRAAWAHNFDTDRSIAATFQSLPGASFVVNGAAQAREAALITGSAEMKWANGFALAATFEGEFSTTTSSYAGKGVARYSW